MLPHLKMILEWVKLTTNRKQALHAENEKSFFRGRWLGGMLMCIIGLNTDLSCLWVL